MIDQFTAYQRSRGFSEATIRRRTMTLGSFSRFLQPMDLAAAELGDVEEWLQTKRSARTRHAYQSDLRVFYTWAAKRDLVDDNPAALLDSIKVPKSLPRPIGDEIHAALLCGSLRTRRMVALGLYAGLRCAEIAAVDCGDVNTKTAPPVLVVRNGKGGKDRVVPLHPVLADLLADLPEHGPLFTWAGRPVRPESVSRTIRRHLEGCGIDATPHQLRHTFGTEAYRVTRNLLLVGGLMGHESTDTTKGYVGLAGDGAEAIGRMFGGDDAA